MGSKLATVAFCLIFAVTFGGVGAGASWVIFRTIQDGMRAKDWVLVKASVDAFNRGQVAYHYTYQGHEYKGDRMGSEILGGSDNLDSWHEDMASILSSAKKDGKPITVFVNPDNPSESMIDRTIRWNLMALFLPFALGFGGVGVGALWFLGKTLVSAAPSKMPGYKGRTVMGTPRAPVARRRSGAGQSVLALWMFAFFWNVISLPIAAIIVPQALRDGEWLALLFLLFPLFGVLMIWGAISATISAIRQRFQRAPAHAAPETQEMAQVAAMQAASTPSSHSGTSTVFARGMINDPAPAPSSSNAPETLSGVRSFDVMLGDDASAGAPPVATPGAQGLESLMKLIDKDAKLTDQQRADLAKLTPSQQEKLAKLGNFLSKFTKR